MSDKNDVYTGLAEHLDRAPIGAPMNDKFIEILKIMYTPEEAELALKLPMMNADIPTLAQSTGMEEGRLKDMLIKMAKKGTVFMNEKGKFRLLPTLVGITETPFFSGKKKPESEKLAGLWREYMYEALFKEVCDREMPVARVIPVDESLESGAKVTPHEKIDELIDMLDYFSVAHCPCRLTARYTGQKEVCDHSTENCFHFGSMGKYMVSVGMARELTRDEAKKLLREAHEEGLVHIGDNHAGRLSTICSCCGDCCVWMRARKELEFTSFSNSNYVMKVDEEKCTGCGVCEERCPIDAVVVNGVSTVNADKCMGCGVCYPTCPSDAISLVEREERTELMNHMEYVQELLKNKGLA